ncbi:MAG: DUF4402 domain-containing protein [Bacteroidales bacterium]
MKNVLALVIITLLSFWGTEVMAQKVIATNFGVTARLADQLSVVKQSDIDFGGIFIPVSSSATVTMDHQGRCSVTTGTTSLYSVDLQRAGSFYVTANKGANFTVQYPSSVQLSLPGGEEANGLTYVPSLFDKNGTVVPSSASTQITVGEDAYRAYTFGGALTVPNSAKHGTYTGNFDMTITWQ